MALAEGFGMADRDSDDTVVRLSRMEAFSDGVFAIAITLLVLELSIPEGFRRASAQRGTRSLAVLSPLVAVIGYLVIAFFLIFPIKLHRRQKAEPAVS
jgi:uncharacterized membrane protein